MFGSEALGVAISLVFVYFLLSLLCSAINEVIAQLIGLRSSTLLEGIHRLVTDYQVAKVRKKGWDAEYAARTGSPLTQFIYAHPLITGLYSKGPFDLRGGRPSYIPADVFARALLHSLVEQVAPTLPFSKIAVELFGLDAKRYGKAIPGLRSALQARAEQLGGHFLLREIESAVKATTKELTAAEQNQVVTHLKGTATQIPSSADKTCTFSDIQQAVLALADKTGQPDWRQKAIDKIVEGTSVGQVRLSFADVASAIVKIPPDLISKQDQAALLTQMAELTVQVASTPPKVVSFTEVAQALDVLPDKLYGDLKRALLALMSGAQTDFTQLQKLVADWFDDAMERVAGWYKRKVQYILAAIGLIVALVLNADSVTLATTLWRDPTLRDAVVIAAEQAVQPTATPTAGAPASPAPGASPATTTTNTSPPPTATPSYPITRIGEIQGELDSLKLPLGWAIGDNVPEHDPGRIPTGFGGWAAKIGGIGLTALALSLGAPFWFQVLSKLVNLRAAGDPPKEPKEPKE